MTNEQNRRLNFILGPCSLETPEISLEVADVVAQLSQRYPQADFFFKGSFDKANRTSLTSPRGPGLKKGLEILQKVKERYGLKTVTDFHEREQVKPVAEVCDVLQVPAFLCRQTDLLVAAAESGAIVKVKKGQFMAPEDMKHVVGKLEASGAREIWLTERGTTFGYQNLVVDMRSFPQMRQLGHRVVIDATHSVQRPGAGNGETLGNREYVPTLLKAALVSGAEGVFLETHPNPDEAISDGANQVPLKNLPMVVEQAVALFEMVSQWSDPLES